MWFKDIMNTGIKIFRDFTDVARKHKPNHGVMAQQQFTGEYQYLNGGIESGWQYLHPTQLDDVGYWVQATPVRKNSDGSLSVLYNKGQIVDGTLETIPYNSTDNGYSTIISTKENPAGILIACPNDKTQERIFIPSSPNTDDDIYIKAVFDKTYDRDLSFGVKMIKNISTDVNGNTNVTYVESDELVWILGDVNTPLLSIGGASIFEAKLIELKYSRAFVERPLYAICKQEYIDYLNLIRVVKNTKTTADNYCQSVFMKNLSNESKTNVMGTEYINTMICNLSQGWYGGEFLEKYFAYGLITNLFPLVVSPYDATPYDLSGGTYIDRNSLTRLYNENVPCPFSESIATYKAKI